MKQISLIFKYILNIFSSSSSMLHIYEESFSYINSSILTFYTATHDSRGRTLLHYLTLAAHLNRLPRTKNKYRNLLTCLLQSVQILHAINLHKVANILIRNQTSFPCSVNHTILHSSPSQATTPLSRLRFILIFYMSRTHPNKEWTIGSIPGDSLCVLVVLLIIGIVDITQ